MRIAYPDQATAQAAADLLWADMQAQGLHIEPGTTGWAIPYQDLDDKGNPIGTDWYVTVDDRVASIAEPAKAAVLWPNPDVTAKEISTKQAAYTAKLSAAKTVNVIALEKSL